MENIAPQFALRQQSPLTKALSLLDKTSLILVAAFLGLLATRGLSDPDYFWHLKTGEFIVNYGTLPDGDIFSHVRFGQQWVLHEWLFEVILYSVYAIGGEFAVTLMTASLGMLAILIVARCALRVTGNQAAVFIAAALAFAAFAGAIVPRPQLISYCLAAYYLSALIEFKYRRANVSTLWIPLAMVVWVNAHGGFLVGVAFLFAFTGCEWLHAWFWGAYADSADRSRLRRLTRVCGLTLAATMANPDFIWHWTYPIMVLGMKANAVIIEWQSPNFHVSGPAQAYLLMASVFVLAYVYASRKRDITEIGIPGLFILNGFISVRHIALASLIAVPFMAMALHDGILTRLGSWWRDCTLARTLDRIPGARHELGGREYLVNWTLLLVLAAAFVTLRPAFERNKASQLASTYPVKAVDYVIEQGIKGRMYNDYNHGGYLIYRLAPQVKVTIDGRADVYGDEFIMDYGVISTGRQGWQEKLAALNVDFAITPIDAPIRQLMMHVEGYREVYVDRDFSVLLRDRHNSAATAK